MLGHVIFYPLCNFFVTKYNSLKLELLEIVTIIIIKSGRDHSYSLFGSQLSFGNFMQEAQNDTSNHGDHRYLKYLFLEL